MPDQNLSARRRQERVMIDGRLVAVNAQRHGVYTTYGNWSCRCRPCSDAHKHEVARKRRDRMATRTLIDGRLVALGAAKHGNVHTYNNWGCRCEPCTRATAEMFSARDLHNV